jgi:hypothetical protein
MKLVLVKVSGEVRLSAVLLWQQGSLHDHPTSQSLAWDRKSRAGPSSVDFVPVRLRSGTDKTLADDFPGSSGAGLIGVGVIIDTGRGRCPDPDPMPASAEGLPYLAYLEDFLTVPRITWHCFLPDGLGLLTGVREEAGGDGLDGSLPVDAKTYDLILLAGKTGRLKGSLSCGLRHGEQYFNQEQNRQHFWGHVSLLSFFQRSTSLVI